MARVPDLLPFLAVAVVVVVVPGVDMALVTRNTVLAGRRSGLITMMGILSGVCVHATAAMLGLSAIVAASSSLFQVVRFAGAAYLIVLGVRSLFAARSAAPVAAPVEEGRKTSPFLTGFATNVLNPKLVVFFLSLLPQFVDDSAAPAAQFALLSLVFLLTGAVWLTFYVVAIDRLRTVTERPGVARVVDVVFGSVLVGLGLRLAVLDRT